MLKSFSKFFRWHGSFCSCLEQKPVYGNTLGQLWWKKVHPLSKNRVLQEFVFNLEKISKFVVWRIRVSCELVITRPCVECRVKSLHILQAEISIECRVEFGARTMWYALVVWLLPGGIFFVFSMMWMLTSGSWIRLPCIWILPSLFSPFSFNAHRPFQRKKMKFVCLWECSPQTLWK